MTAPIAAAAVASTARRAFRAIVITITVIVVTAALCVAGVTLSLLDGLTSGVDSSLYALACGQGAQVDPRGTLPEVLDLTEDQARNAATIISVGQERRVPPRGWVIGVATALQESRLSNLPHLGADNDHDSLGLFQQRPSQGWGTPAQLADPDYQSRQFFGKLVAVDGWETLPLTVAAQYVQRSAYPDAYAKHEPRAATIVDILTGGAGRAVGSVLTLRCTSAGEIAASGWTVPVRGTVTSGFQTADRPGHNGVDIAVPRNTPVRAATAGVVIVATCNAHTGGRVYSCDRDGGADVRGCGWYVDILHAGNVSTRYCHLEQSPFVAVGQRVAAGEILGLAGSSGHSSGPHLHFEVHVNGDGSRTGAIDPVSFLHQIGAPLAVVV